MLKYLLSILVFGFTSSAFGQDSTFLSTNERLQMERFRFTEEEQEAVFFIGTGYTGGPGSMPILDISNWNGRPLRYNDDLPIYLNGNFREQLAPKMPGCMIGSPQIIVSATIRMVKKEAVISTPNHQKMAYYEVEVIELNNIEVKTQPCRD